MAFLDELVKKLKKPFEYFDPTSNQGQNFWSTKTAQALADIQSSPIGVFSSKAVESTGIPKYLNILNAAGLTLLGTAQMKKQPEKATQMLEKAYALRQKTGTEGSFDQGVKSGLKTLGSGAEATARTILTLKGAPKMLTPTGAASTAAIGALGGGISKLLGGSFAEGAGSAVGYSPATRAFTSMSDPFIRRLIPGASGNVAQRLASGLGNLAQDEALAAATGQKNTGTSRALSFILGAAYGPKMFSSQADQDLDELLRRGRSLGIKGVSPNAFNVHPEDQDIMERFYHEVIIKKRGRENLGRLGEEAQLLAEHYLGKNWATVSNEKLAKAFAWVLDMNRKIPPEARSPLGRVPGFTQGFAQGGAKAAKANLDQELAGMGYDKGQIAKISAKEKRRILKENIPPFAHESFEGTFDQKSAAEGVARGEVAQEEGPQGLKRLFNRLFNPLKDAPQPVQETANAWRKETLTARAEANALAQKFAHIPSEDGWKMVRYIQNPTQEAAQQLGFDPSQYRKEIKELRRIYDQLRQEGIKKGLEIGYLDNYLNQVWEESWGEIAAKVRGAGTKPYFTKERIIPSYEEGMKLGLTPRFTHPAQLVAHYKEALGKALANKKLVDQLVDSGYLVPAGDAPLDWVRIDAPLFPKATRIIGKEKRIISDYKAPPNVAEAINNIFQYGGGRHGGLEEIAELGAKVSRAMQEISLSGGYGPANAFTYGQMIKEITAGRVRSPIASFFRSFSEKASNQFFAEHQNTIRMMSQEGIPVYHSADYGSMFDNLAKNKTLKDKLGDVWNQVVNEPTFKRFMPMLAIHFFEDVYNQAVKDGLAPQEARKLAGEATKNFYGIVDNFTRSKFVEDAVTSVFFAPKFRESMVNFWINNLKALSPKTWGNPAFKANRKFLVGTVITYLVYNALNKALTGHAMSDNKGGKELSLEIPVGEGRSIFVPILPSVGTMPRRLGEMAGALKEGDVATATQKAGSFLSQPVSLGSQLLSNRTFYGGPIYQRDDSALAKLGKLGGYAFEQTSHPLIGEPMAVLQGRKTPFEALLGVAEIPAYPSASTPEKRLPLAKVDVQPPTAGASGVQAAATSEERPSLLKQLFSLRKKEEPLRELPTSTKELAVIYNEAQRILENYEEKRAKIEYGRYSAEGKRQKDLQALEEDRAYAQAVLERIEKERPDKVFEIGLQTYSATGSMTVEQRAKWAAEQLTQSAEDQGEFQKKLRRMLEAGVITKGVAELLREEYGLPVYRYKSGGKIVSLGDKALSEIFKTARQDAEATRKLYQSLAGGEKASRRAALDTILRLYSQGGRAVPTKSSLEAILSQKRKLEPSAKIDRTYVKIAQ